MTEPRDDACVLLHKADHDLRAGQAIVSAGEVFDMACFHAQQAAEKGLKAMLTVAGDSYPFTHDLELLFDMTVERYPEVAPLRGRVLSLTPFAVIVRYDQTVDPSEAETCAALDTAREVYDLAARILGEREP